MQARTGTGAGWGGRGRPGEWAAAAVAVSALAAVAFGQPFIKPEPLKIDLTQSARAQQIMPTGPATNGLSYSGTVVSGPADALVPVANSYLGPTIHTWAGQDVSIRLINQIGQESITHWHGLDVPADMDGYPTETIPSGGSFQYRFPIRNRAGTYWYHPHTNMLTAPQVYAGLAGFFIVHDKEELKLRLPTGAYDLPLCIQDATLDTSNQRVYNPGMVAGFLGNTQLVNGRANYVHSAATRVYRLRLLNGAVSRIYKLAFSDGTPMVAIGTDGGLLDKPRTYPYIMLAPGKRIELWADFRNKAVGSQVTLSSLAFTSSGAQGSAQTIMRFSIDRAEAETRTLPASLASVERLRLGSAVNKDSPKVYPINFVNSGGHAHFTLNGGPFDPALVAANEVARCGTVEVIKVTNLTGTTIIPHPIHFHGRQFQMLDRTIAPAGLTSWNTVKDGIVMNGWKDTFLIMPYETVRILVRHGDYPGKFIYHCHNLEHEDMDMMRNFRLDP